MYKRVSQASTFNRTALTAGSFTSSRITDSDKITVYGMIDADVTTAAGHHRTLPADQFLEASEVISLSASHRISIETLYSGHKRIRCFR